MEWSTIQEVIVQVISKSNKREALGRFEIMRKKKCLLRISFERKRQ